MKHLLLIPFILIAFIVNSQETKTDVTIEISKPEISENESSTLTATIDAATSSDISIPLNFSGSAENGLDYTVDFASKGEESLIGQISEFPENYGTLADGRHVFLNGNTLKVMSSDLSSENTASLSDFDFYQYLIIEENSVYLASDRKIVSIDLTDISSNQATEAELVSISDNNSNITSSPSVENGQILYQVENFNTNNRQLWLLESGASEPEILTTYSECCYTPVLLNGEIYLLEDWGYRKFIDDELSSTLNYENDQNFNLSIGDKMITKDGGVYIFKDNFSTSEKTIVKLVFTPDGATLSQPFDVEVNENVNNTTSFDFDPSGNLILLNQSIENNETIYQLNSYQLAEQIRIKAGEVSGTVTFNSIDDNSYEEDETIVINYEDSDSVDVSQVESTTLTITDNDVPPSVRFDLSDERIVENSATPVTLTATLDEVSGFETTIAFTTNGTASNDEYEVSSESIVIPAGSESGSVEVTTLGIDDTEVEVLETIVFTIGEIENATSETTEVVLNLVSDDNPNLESIVTDVQEFAEHESSTLTATIDAATSSDISIPLNFSGSAENGLDYTVDFASKGEESLIGQVSGQPYNYGTLADGRHVFLNDNTLKVMSSDLSSENTASLPDFYQYLIIEENSLYLASDRKIVSIDLTDISSNQATKTELVSIPDNNSYITSSPSVKNGQILYEVENFNTNNSQLWSLESGASEPEILTTYSGCCYSPVVINGEIYLLGNQGYRKFIDDELSSTLNYENNQNIFLSINDKMITKNGGVYIFKTDFSTSEKTIVKLVFTPDGVTLSQPFDVEVNENVNNTSSFDFDPSGNLVLLNQSIENNETIYQLNSYQLAEQIRIKAGEVSGSTTFIGIEDDLNAPGEEDDENIEISFLTPVNVNVVDPSLIENITLTILNNEIDFVLDENAFSDFPSLETSSVAWGDFDRDGDQDMAVMGSSFFSGVITRLYENNEGVFINSFPETFEPSYEGDLIWVDYNKDGFIDLIVSGLDSDNNPSTIIYKNVDGETFTPSDDLTLPDLFNTSMDSGDLDNDGDIDFVINGLDIDNNWKKYIYKREGSQLILEEDFNNQFNVDEGYDNGIVKIVDFEKDGDQDIYMLGDKNSKIKQNTLITESSNETNSTINLTNLSDGSMSYYGDYVYMMGKDSNDKFIFIREKLAGGQEFESLSIDGLIDGDIAVGDYNNDGYVDLVVTGENEKAEPVTKIYNGSQNGFVENTKIQLIGLRSSTAEWVDYDLDGDLDLFLSGVNEDGEFSLLYENKLKNKSNTSPDLITNLSFEDLGNGKVRLSWDPPKDDFSENLGYVVRLGTSELGSELSNTESNLENGQRLITKSPQINTNSYEVLLDPGNYFWSVQSVDSGLKGSPFSEEQSFQLTYEWKLLNQGGIIDRSINSVKNPIVKLVDIDGDNDMDLVFGSRAEEDIRIFTLGSERFEYFDKLSGSKYISDIKFIDVNDDQVLDVLINTWSSSDENSIKLFNSNSTGSFDKVFENDGLHQAKIELIDINNDGVQEIIHVGESSETFNSELKVFVYEQNANSLNPQPIDISDQIAGMKSGSFAFGDIDQDEDMDFGIMGQTNSGAQSKMYLNETAFSETVNPSYILFPEINFPPATDSTLDFVDFDSDGDLDILITGFGAQGSLFKVFSNNGQKGDELEFIEVEDTGLLPIRNASIDYGDFNADGYLDILYTGLVAGQGQISKLVEYDPNTRSYIDSDFDLSDIVNASIAFGDIDGDDDLDFTIAGESISDNSKTIIKTFLNVRNESAEVISNSNEESNFVVSSKQNEQSFIVNQKPSKPSGLSAEALDFDENTGYYKVKFKWDPSTDDHTNQDGLSYALKVGTTDGGSEIMKVNALPNGYRLSAGRGNVEQNQEWLLNIPEGDYYWSVQSVDASFSGSAFSETALLDATSLSVKRVTEDPLDVIVFPNPVTSGFVKVDAANIDSFQAQLFDLQGRLLFSKKVNDDLISFEGIAGGVYLLKLITDNKIKTVKIIVE